MAHSDEASDDRNAQAQGTSPPGALRAGCSLNDTQLGQRLEWIREELLPQAGSIERLPDGLRVQFAATSGVEAKLESLIAAERACCPGLVFEQDTDTATRTTRLTIRGAGSEAARELERLFGPFTGPRPRGLRQLLVSVGIGGTVGVVVCCVLPIGLGLLLGGLAAPLSGFDQPLPIVMTSLAGGLLGWRWLSRRSPVEEP